MAPVQQEEGAQMQVRDAVALGSLLISSVF